MGIRSAVVIGFGRFGELLCDVLSESFEFSVIEMDPSKVAQAEANYPVVSMEGISDFEFVFVAVPISQFEEVVKEIAPKFKDEQVVVDVCSVKVFPARVMQENISRAQIIATHPLFGPDSAQLGLEGLKVAYSPIRCDEDNAQYLRDAWQKTGVQVIDTTPEEHDKDTSFSQAFTYSVARIILNMKLPRVEFDTRSYQSITRVAMLSARDTEQLFHDMMYYNPYFPGMLKQLEASWLDTLATLETIADEPRPSVFDDINS